MAKNKETKNKEEEYKLQIEAGKTSRAQSRASAAKSKLALSKIKRKKKTTIKSRERASRGILTAMGVIGGKQTYAGAGRPRGTYKYGVPIHIYKERMKQKQAQYQQYQQEQYQKLAVKGFTPEQVQALQQQQAMQELEQPTQQQAIQQLLQRQQRIRAQAQPQQQMQQPMTQNHNIIRKRYAQDMPFQNPADEEIKFTKWMAESSISPNTQRLMEDVRRIQLKGRTSNIENDRRHRERRMLGKLLSLFDAHKNMTNVDMDFVGVPEDNILFAPSIWKEQSENNILRPRPSNVLSGENRLNFF